MALARAALSQSDRRHVIGRSGGCCNLCRIPVFLDNAFGEKARIGDDVMRRVQRDLDLEESRLE